MLTNIFRDENTMAAYIVVHLITYVHGYVPYFVWLDYITVCYGTIYPAHSNQNQGQPFGL